MVSVAVGSCRHLKELAEFCKEVFVFQHSSSKQADREAAALKKILPGGISVAERH